MKFHLRLWLIVAFVLLCGSCTKTPDLSGGSSDHENVLEAYVVNQTNLPVHSSTVRLVNNSHWARLQEDKYSLVDSSYTTDKYGTVYLDSTECLKSNFDMDVNGQMVNLRCSDIEDFGSVRLERYGVLYGVTIPNQTIAIYGSLVHTQSDDHGVWTLRVPPGERGVVVYSDDYWRAIRYVTIEASDSVEFVIPKNVSRMMIENFEDGENVTLLHFWNGGGNWWTAFDSIGTEEDHIEPDAAALDLMSAREYVDSLDSYVLHVGLYPNESAQIPKAMLGFNLGQPASTKDTSLVYKDFSAVDSIHLDMLGSGTIYVQLICQAEGEDYRAVFEYPVDLNEKKWTSYSLAVDDFKKLEGSLLDNKSSWNEVKTRCKSIGFYAKDSTDLWVDNIEFDGARLRAIE
jgi:hypothetical protein